MRERLRALMAVVGLFLTTRWGTAAPVVTFYNDQASFLAATSPVAVLNFEGIVPDNSVRSFLAYHSGKVTFTSPTFAVAIVGKNADALGAPFDSALLISSSTPSSMLATFDAGSNVTAVGGFFLNAYGNFQSDGTFRLTGATGQLDMRDVPLGIASRGKPKTFFGYTVLGDTISSLSVNTPPNAPAWDDFTYGTVPEPASVSLILVASIGLLMRRQSCLMLFR